MPNPTESAVAANNVHSPLADPKNREGQAVPRPDYTTEEILYIGGLQQRLERARRLRDVRHDEFDGMTFIQQWDMEEKLANTWIPPKLNKEDTTFVSGTVRQKIFSLLANFSNLDLGPNLIAYDENNMEVAGLGHGMETVMEKVAELDNDDEKKLMRQYELLKHGYVFVQELWEERWTWAKKLIKPFEGRIKSVEWKKRMKMLYAKPIRRVIPGPNVYLGDITQYDFNSQPYAFTVSYHSYDDRKSIYGQKNPDGTDVWERWKHVTKAVTVFAPEAGTGTSSIVYNTWRLTEVRENYVEEIHYQDPITNEYQIILNGVLMYPVGFPLSEVVGWEGYNLIQQNLAPIHPYFAYGESAVKRMRTQVAILDEMLKLGVLKTQKSFIPARANLSGKVLSPRLFMPGKITAGINPADVPTFDQKETEGVTVSELNFIAELQRNVDANSVSANFQGQQQKGGNDVTATEVLELQRQAKQTLGIYVFSVSLLEWKLGWARLFNLLGHWFDPVDEKLDEARGKLKDVYRTANVQKPIPGKGIGRHMVVPTTEMVTPSDVKQAEDHYQEKYGMPFKITVINPDVLKAAKHTWQLTITAREKKTSELQKVLFSNFMKDAQLFGQDLNMQYMEEEFAMVWDKDPSKMFQRGNNQAPPVQGAGVQPQVAAPVPGAKPVQVTKPNMPLKV